MAKVLSLTPDVMRGVVQVRGQGIPAGSPTLVTRQSDRIPEPIRGGDLTVSTGGFILEDPEPPFGVDLTYRATVTVPNRAIQTNRVLNPKAAVNTNNWTAGTGRVLTRDAAPAPAPPRDATTALKIGPNSAGLSAGQLTERTLLMTQPLGFGSGRWFISGQMMYDSPDAWLWMDALAAGTWQTVKDKGTWGDVRAMGSPGADQPFASLWCAVVGPTTATAERRRNRVPNPNVAAGSTNSWFGTAGTGGTAALSGVTTGGPSNGPGSFARLTYSVANSSVPAGTATIVADGRASAALPIPVTPGTAYSAAIYARTSIAQSVRAILRFYDAAGVALSSSVSDPKLMNANAWTRLITENTVAPAGAAYCRVEAVVVAGPGAAAFPVGATFDATMAQLEIGPTAGPYFSGASAATGSATFSWAGTANASQSILTTTERTQVVAPFQIIGASVLSQGNWLTFQGWVDVPAGMPVGSQLAFLQGTADREYGTTFWLTTLMVTPEAEMTAGAVTYFDGDSVPPVNPAANLVPGYDWFPAINDASMAWSGTPNNSSSVFTGPSVIAAEATTSIAKPSVTQLPRHRLPLMLSDPILPQINTWFELMEIGDLSFAARQDLYDVINRGPRIAVSSARAWPDGELRLMTYTLEQASVAERMFAPGRILFLRNPDPDFPENVWYLAIGNVTQGRISPQAAKKPERVWQVPFAKVERPVGLIAAASGVSWSTVKASYTWDDLRRMRADWLDVAVTAP